MAENHQADLLLPPFAPFPEATFRKGLVPEEWEACLDAWIALAESHLRLPDNIFIRRAENHQSGLIDFLISYCQECSRLPDDTTTSTGSKATSLRRVVFILVHRLLSSDTIPDPLLDFTFLADFAVVYQRSGSLQDLLSSLWKRRGKQVEGTLNSAKSEVIRGFESGNVNNSLSVLRQLIPLLHALPDAGAFFMVGSDLLDGLTGAYVDTMASNRRILVAFAYVCLTSLCKGSKPNFSLLSDHLYSLKANAEQLEPSSSLLADIITNTSLLHIIKDSMTAQDSGRARKLATDLTPLKDPAIVRPKRSHTPRLGKGKAKAKDQYGHGAGEIHIHRMSLITQIQDLFPDLGSAFIIKLLDEYADNVETVTAHLLDNSLPPHLQALDRTSQLPPSSVSAPDLVPDLVPRSTPPPSPPRDRRNVFDNDELSNLTTSALSRLHLGRKGASLDADTVLADRAAAPNKAAILSALAAFDADDDERDDTYDVSDVGGSVDATASATGDEAGEDGAEEALYAAWKSDGAVFGRDAATRRGAGRRRLREETGWTDEAIEGWAVMLGRDPRRVRRLEARYGTFTGQQTVVERTAWRADEGDGEEGSSRGGRGRGRARGGWRGRGRGNVAGSASDEGTQRARQRKEASKGSRANHNRRDQRARKMARGGLPG